MDAVDRLLRIGEPAGAPLSVPAARSAQTEILQQLGEIRASASNEREMDNFGYDVNMKVRWVRKDGSTKKTEIRDYQTTWVEETPRLELCKINAKPLDHNQREEQLQRRKEWQKALQNGERTNDSHRIPFTWTEMMQKYDFTIDHNDHSSAYVLNFHHKNVDSRRAIVWKKC